MADESYRLPNPHPTPGAKPARAEQDTPAQGPRDNHQAHADKGPANPPAASPGLLRTVKDAVWPKAPPHPSHHTESLREIIETVVFVVVLVLLLKSFIAEAFVIPTGSMADTLLGYQKQVTCPQCGHEFPVNCSQEADPQDGGRPELVTGCECPNCELPIHLVRPDHPGPLAANEVRDPGWNSGDRVLVLKPVYDLWPGKPERWQVVVFKYPFEPQKNWVQMNYIKRLVGLSNETVGIWYGDLYQKPGEEPAPVPVDVPQRDHWQKTYMYERMMAELPEGFKILQKPPDKVLAMMRLVYNNDQPARDLEGVLPPRWAGDGDSGAWDKAPPHGFRHVSTDAEQLHWLRYRHILRPPPGAGDRKPEPELITDVLGYNTYRPKTRGGSTDPNWVGDLILECEVTVDDPQGMLVLELSRGSDRFRARWDLATGQCKLLRTWAHEGKGPPKDEDFKELESAPTTLRGKGTYRVRFANVDQRLTVWVDGRLPFSEGHSYAQDPPKKHGPYPNDLQPASIGVKGSTVSVHKLKLWRDTYYTLEAGRPDGSPNEGNWSDPSRWEPLRGLQAKTLYVQPGHYLCLGDNSPESSDGRNWGTVPERLMLGQALAVYYPFYFPIWPLKSPVNRVGPIE